MVFAFDPGPIVLLAAATVLYVRAIHVLGRRGWRVGRWQQAAWYGGIALTAIGLLGPPDVLSDDLMSAHMAQHLLIADLAAPLLLAGIRTPVLQNYLPPRLLAVLARRRGLRRAFRALRRPFVAVPLFVVVLYGWHFAFAFEGALRHPLVHALQHLCFVGASVLVWWPVIEPERGRLRGELWKAGHVLSARILGMFLGMAFILMRAPAYVGYYGERAREHGLTPLADQQIAGGMMLGLDFFVVLFALGFFFWRAAREYDREEAAAQAARAEARTPAS